MSVIHHPSTPDAIARLRSWLPYLLLIFILLSLFIGLENTHNDLTTNETELEKLTQELENTRQELKDTLALYDLPKPRIIKGRGQFDEQHQIILLRGQRVNHTFPRRSFYESGGIYTLNSGSWSLNASGIGGPEDTGSSTVSLQWNAAPQACIERPNGFWADALRVNCPVRLEWTLESRYPYASLQLMPIEGLILPPTRR